jgi:hypothetical protein
MTNHRSNEKPASVRVSLHYNGRIVPRSFPGEMREGQLRKKGEKSETEGCRHVLLYERSLNLAA